MKRFVLAAVFLACACTQPADAPTANDVSEGPSLEAVTLPLSDRAGNRMEALAEAGDRSCTADGAWCVAVFDNSAIVSHGGENDSLPIDLEDSSDGPSVWPQIVRVGNDESVIVGIIQTDEEMYSGGSGSASRLTLYEVSGGAAREVLTLPYSGAADIRACFDEDDERQRAGACRDIYEFMTRISLDESITSGPPHIVLETAAASYPGRETRNADSLEAPTLTERDLVWAQDATCSYRRLYTRGGDGLYAPDQPLPACSDYLEP